MYKLRERRIGIQMPEYRLIHTLKQFKRELGTKVSSMSDIVNVLPVT